MQTITLFPIYGVCVLGTVSSSVDKTEKGRPVYSRCVHVHVKGPVEAKRMCITEYKLHQCWEKVVECVLFVAAAVFLFS